MRRSPESGVAAVRAAEEWRAKILVVDDNAATRYQITRVLKGEGHYIDEAVSGSEALQKVADFQPDLLVMDVRMPDMLGFEVTERLRKDPAAAHVSILHVSATYTDADSLALGLGKGADAYLTHPVEPRVLTATVGALLRIQKYEKQLVELIDREAVARQEAERALAVAERVELDRGRLFEEMERALRGRDEFIAMATHDLRSPLNALQLKIELISQLSQQGEGLPRAELRRHLSAAQLQLTQVADLLAKLLDTTRVNFEQVLIQWEPVDLGQIATETVGRMAPHCEAADCEIEVEAAPGIIGLWDPIRVEQVITNLLSNAIKYGGADGAITVKVTGDSRTARVDVHDNGPGITPEDQARMFAAFERGRGEQREGFGLGLWIVRRIVEALGGHVWVQSGSGKGSTFTVTLPRERSS